MFSQLAHVRNIKIELLASLALVFFYFVGDINYDIFSSLPREATWAKYLGTKKLLLYLYFFFWSILHAFWQVGINYKYILPSYRQSDHVTGSGKLFPPLYALICALRMSIVLLIV